MVAIGVGVGPAFAGGSVAAWTPARMAPHLLIEGRHASTFTLSGADVVEWRDQSTHARHAGQANALYRPSLAGDVVTFTRAQNDWLTATALPDHSAGYYVAMVGELSAVGAVQQVFRADFGLGASGMSIWVTAGNELITEHPSRSTLTVEIPVAAGDACREFGYDGANMRYRRGVGAWTSAARLSPGGFNGTHPAGIGAYHSGAQPASMTLRYMIMICGRWPSDAEILAHRNYVLARYGV